MEIRWYYQVLYRGWRLITIGTLAITLVAFVFSLFSPRSYEAIASVSILRTRTDVTLDPRFETLSEDEILRFASTADFNARRQTLTTLARSDAVLQEVINSLDDSGNLTVAGLRTQARVVTSGNLLQLTITSNSPSEAERLSNAWSEVFSVYANNVYRQTEATTSVDDQLAEARTNYDGAQAELVEFLGDNQIDELNLGITTRESLIRQLRDSYVTSAIDSLAISLDSAERLPLLIANAQVLREQVEDGASVASQVTALVLEVGGLSLGVQLPEGLQVELVGFDAEGVDSAELSDTLDQLIISLTSLQNTLDEQNIVESVEILTQPDFDRDIANQIEDLQAELDALRANFESEVVQRTELETERNLAWENYLLLRNKAVELNISSTTADTEVVIFAPALRPTVPAGPNVLLNTMLAFALGLTLTVVSAIVLAHVNEARKS